MKYSIYCLIAIGCLSLFSSCEGDDDSSMPLIYEVCDMTLTFTENDKSNITSLSVDQIPQSIRTYVAGNFAGFGIKSASSFETEAKDYFEIIASNNGKLLFDNEGSFLCGDDSFSTGVYEEEEEEYEENEDINPEDLPQSILDYIAQNHPNTSIDEAELEDGEYEIELDNGVELCFDLQGNFLGDC